MKNPTNPDAKSQSVEPISRALSVSFEFFPPNSEKMEATLWKAVERLEPLNPRFVSVTYGAGGSTRERTHRTVERILTETRMTPAAHLTCVGAEREQIDAVVRAYAAAGVEHIVALRGDAPNANEAYVPHPRGYANAAELVKGISDIANFEISVAAYPEVHPDAASARADMDNLKRKIDAGATRAITQFFFEPDTFLRFLDRARAAGIGVPIVPGILPISNFKSVVRFAKRCASNVPQRIFDLFEGLDDNPQTHQLVAAVAASELCMQLREHGVTEFHFYTLNRADLTYATCHRLGLRAQQSHSSNPPRAAGE